MLTEITKKKEKESSFDKHAQAIQGDIARLTKAMETGFKSIREEMATKFEIKATNTNLLEIRDDVRRLNSILVSKADLSEAIRRELDRSPFAKESEVKELRERVIRVETELQL